MSISRLSAVVLLFGMANVACSKIPKDRSAVDAVDLRATGDLREGDVSDKISTAATPKFLGLFRGVAFDYEIYDETVVQRDLARIERYYQGHGYLDAHVRAARVIRKSSSHVRVEIDVDAGPPTLNRRVTVEGLAGVPPLVAEAARLAATSALPAGDRFDEDAYRKATVAVGRALTDRGFAYAKVDRNADIDVGAHVADYVFSVTSGPPATFGPVTITGLDPDGAGPRPQEIEEGPLRRALHIRPGTPYSTKEIDSATDALLNLGVFSAVHVVPKLSDPATACDAGPPRQDAAPCAPLSTVIPVNVEVEPGRLRKLGLGGGAEFDEIKTELHLLTTWEHHNFLGGLRDLSISASPGVVLYPFRLNNYTGTFHPLAEEHFRMQLKQPGCLEARTACFLQPAFNVYPLLVAPNPPPADPVVGYVEPKASIGAERNLSKLYARLDYNIQAEVPFAYTQGLNQALQSIILSYPELVTTLDLRDDRLHPHVGLFLGNNLQFAGGPFGGSAEDLRIQPEIRFYVPLGRRVTFGARSSVGFLVPLGGYEEPLLTKPNHSTEPYIPVTPCTTTKAMPTCPTPPSTETVVTEAQLQVQEKDIEIVYFRGFSSGGPNTNRGFPVRGIAPFGFVPFLSPSTAAALVANSCLPNAGSNSVQTANCTIPIAGLSLWELSTEFRFEISGPFSTAIFCDSGDVSPTKFQLRPDRPHLSCGAGARYDTPVGPIRLDIGYRIEPLQFIGNKDDYAANAKDPTEGIQPRIFTLPLAVAVGIGEAF
jgi:outer membrane protein insertion porin family/translocation and assembly module TamA